MLLHWINGFFGLVFGIFALTNTIFPYAITIPVLRRLKKDGVLVRDVPKVLIHSSPVIWTLLSAVVGSLYWFLFTPYFPALAVGYLISLSGVVFGIARGTKRRDIASDLIVAYEDYLDIELLHKHPLFQSLKGEDHKGADQQS